MEKSKRSKIFYRIMTILTLILPIPTYLILNACIFSVEPDYQVVNGDITKGTIEEVVIPLKEEKEMILTYLHIDKETEFKTAGSFTLKDNKIVICFNETTIFQLENGKFNRIIKDEESSLYSFEDYTGALFSEQLSTKLPLSIIVGIVAMLIIALIIGGKMDLLKKRPRLSVMVSLSLGTLILLMLETVVASMLGVFMVATATWGAYVLEYVIYNKDKIFKAQPSESEVIKGLSDMLNKYN